MRRTGITAIAAILLLAAGCGGEPEAIVHDDADATTADESETPIADELRKPLDKAAAVEDMALERKAEMDRRLAEMEGETEDDEEDP